MRIAWNLPMSLPRIFSLILVLLELVTWVIHLNPVFKAEP
jgi:hypothetical protein